MSLVEILTVIGIIVVLIAILLPGLVVARKNAIWAKSQSNMRQVYTYLIGYAGNYRETIVPAAFDYTTQTTNPLVQVRTASPTPPPIGLERYGSWSDILWTDAKLGAIVDVNDPTQYNYRFDSPDRVFYERDDSDDRNVLRSAAPNTKAVGGDEAIPFGTGTPSVELGHPGYFAANEFFDVRPADGLHPNRGKWWVTGQIVRPSQSVYLIDNYGGEVTQTSGNSNDTYQLDFTDFRYSGDVCLMLFLDGRVDSQPNFDSIRDLEESRQIRFRDLDKQKAFYLP